MLTLKQIRDDKEAAIRKLAKKGVDAAPVIEKIETLDDRRKAIQVELDNTLAAQNKAAKEIGALMGQGRREEAEERKRFVADLKEKSNRLQAESREVQEELQAAIVTLPNFPAEIVPEGKTAEDNLVVKLVESYTELPENPLMLSFVMAAPVLGHILPFYDIKHGGKGIAATFGCFLGLLPHWIPLCVLAGIFIFFSCVVKINPNYYRTVATYILAAICTVWLEPNHYIVFGFLLIAASVLAKLFMSAEEKEHFEVKLAWKH